MEPWILPVVQGYVEIRTLVLHSNNPPNVLQTSQREPPLGAKSSELGEKGGEKREEGAHEEGEEEEEEEEEDKGDMITFSPKLDGERVQIDEQNATKEGQHTQFLHGLLLHV